tara:strand:- start:214 stop:549 length:336 start_codon:yes stop_codon:yes gene_type:complete
LFLYKARKYFKCPLCKKGKLFKGLIEISKRCNNCNVSFEVREDIGDFASWFTTLFLCTLLIPSVLILELFYKPNLKNYILFFFPLTIMLTVLLLRLMRVYFLRKRFYLENE